MSDLLITDEPEVPFVARNVVNQLADLWEVPVDKRQVTNDVADQFVARLFAEHAKALAETATRLGYGLGRRDAAEEIAADLRRLAALHPGDGWQAITASALVEAARIAREFATRPSEPSISPDDSLVSPASVGALAGQPEASEEAK